MDRVYDYLLLDQVIGLPRAPISQPLSQPLPTYTIRAFTSQKLHLRSSKLTMDLGQVIENDIGKLTDEEATVLFWATYHP
jgi:hypothetical protein